MTYSRRSRFAALLFPVTLWLFATFFLLGDIGKYNDDWYYVQRDPVSGAVESWVLDRPVHFWRPLYRVVVPALLTLFPEQDWVNHLISACAHGVVGLLLWRLLRDLNVTRIGAATAALWFIVWPSYFEAVFWTCALPTLLSAAAVVGAWILLVRFARGVSGGWAAAVTPLIFFVSACLNEQAACGLAAMPFLYMAARPGGERLSRSLWRGGLPTLAAALLLGLYVVLHMRLQFKPPALGHDSVVAPLNEMPRQVHALTSWLRGQFISGDFLTRMLRVGARTVLEYPARAAVVGVLLLCGLPWWARSIARAEERPGARAPWLIAAGVAAFMAPLVPIVAMNYWFMPRITYAPAMGIAMFIAGLFSLIGPHQRERGVRSRTAIATFIGVLLVVCAIMMVAPQQGYRERARRDEREAAQLMRLMPSPAPNTAFAAVRIARPAAPSGGAGRFDGYFCSVLSSWWSAGWFLRMEYRRADLDCGYMSANGSAITYLWPDRAAVHGVGDVPWARVVPFVIDENGEVHLVTQIRSGELVVRIPQTVQAIEERGDAGAPGLEYVLP